MWGNQHMSKQDRDDCQRVLRVMQDNLQIKWNAWYRVREQQERPENPLLQPAAVEGKGFAGISPYQGFPALTSTCWINSVLPCLFHCHAVREALSGREHGPTWSCATISTGLHAYCRQSMKLLAVKCTRTWYQRPHPRNTPPMRVVKCIARPF